MERLKDRYKRFKEWEQQPHQVAPLSEEQHECATCGTHFEGNYCPRCSQSAQISRYSFKKAFLLFIDVWGLGNRGMFRSIRDLLLRPGFMIRDYLRGMQMAYFPPFKMYFLLVTLSLVIDSGLNIKGMNNLKEWEKESMELVDNADKDVKQAEEQENKTTPKAGKVLTKEEKRAQAKKDLHRIVDKNVEWVNKHSSWVILFSLLLFSFPLWLMFRHSPAIPDIRLSECFVAMVYISNMISIYNLVPSLLCFSEHVKDIYQVFALLLITVPIKQLSGFSYWSTIWRLSLVTISFITVMLSVYIAGCYIYLLEK